MDAAVRAHLHDALGIVPRIRAWAGAGKLPCFLQGTVRLLTRKDRPILLAIDQRPDQGVTAVRGQMDKLRHVAGMPVVCAAHTLAFDERKRLVELRVPVLVPGNQLYLPDFGIDLRDSETVDPLSSAFSLRGNQDERVQLALDELKGHFPWCVDWISFVRTLAVTPTRSC